MELMQHIPGCKNLDLHDTGYTGSYMHKHKGSQPQVTLNTVYITVTFTDQLYLVYKTELHTALVM